MSELNRKALHNAKVELEEQIREKERQVQHLSAELVEDKRRLEAVKCLMGEVSENSSGTLHRSLIQRRRNGSTAPGESFAPMALYVPVILESLAELGGHGRTEEAIELIGKRLGGVLTDGDRQMLPGGGDVRWRNRAQWQRLKMVRQGLLRNDSPRGIWAISDRGRQWLQEFKKKMP